MYGGVDQTVSQHMKRIKLRDQGEVLGKCRRLDIYGKPVRLTFKGADSYKTQVGATVTVLAALTIISFALWSLLSADARITILNQSIHIDSLYEKNSDILGASNPLDEDIKPGKLFAFGF